MNYSSILGNNQNVRHVVGWSVFVLSLVAFIFSPSQIAEASQRPFDEWQQFEVDTPLPTHPPEYTTKDRDARLGRVTDLIGGRWQLIQNDATGVARFVLGTGGELAVATNGSKQSFDATARAFIDQNPDLFGVSTSDLRLLGVNQVKGKTAVLYQQVYRGVPVLDGVVRVYFHGNSHIAGFGSDAHPDIHVAVKPAVSQGALLSLGSADLVAPGALKQTKAELRIVPQYSNNTEVSYRLVWDTDLDPEAEGPSWDVMVDAHSGQVIYRKSRAARSTGDRTRIAYDFDARSTAVDNVTGYVYGEVYSPVGQALEFAAVPPADAKLIKPLPYIKVTVGTEVGYTDETGYYSIPYTGAATTVTVRLEGLWAKVTIEGETEAELTAPYDPADPAPVDFTFEFSSATPNARADELNAYYHVSIMHTFINDVVSQIVSVDYAQWQAAWDYQIPVEVNDSAAPINASGGSAGLIFGSGDNGVSVRVAPSLQTSIVYHEYGHALSDVIRAFVGAPGSGGSGVNEGNSDVASYLQNIDRFIWRGFWVDPTCESRARDIAWGYQYYDLAEIHFHGTAIANFHRELYLAWTGGGDIIGEDCGDIRGDLWTYSHNPTRDELADLWMSVHFFDYPTDMLLQVITSYILDDDDGDLTNGTPHIASLCDATENMGFFRPGDVWVCSDANEFDTDWVDLSDQFLQLETDPAQFMVWYDGDGGGFPDLVRGTTTGNNSRLYSNKHLRNNPPFSYDPNFGSGRLSTDDEDLSVYAVAYADYNKDGQRDKILARNSRANVIIDGRGLRIELNANLDQTRAVSWVDFNNDGALDLFFGNVQHPSHDGSNNLYQYDPVTDSFTDVATAAIATAGDVYGSVGADFDNNGLVDLFLALDATAGVHKLFLNFSDATGPVFTEHAVSAGTSIARSIACKDYDRDGLMDIALVNEGHELFVLRNQGGGVFTDVTASTGLSAASGSVNDAAWGDYDNDGWTDLFVATLSGVADELWRNSGNSGGPVVFSSVAGGPWEAYTGHSQCVAWGDQDANGFPDVAVLGTTSLTDHMYTYLKTTNSWLTLRLRGNRSNAEGIGAVVTVSYGSDTATRQMIGSHGLGANDPALHFGLGGYVGTANVTIAWPSGEVQQVDDLAINQRITVEEPAFELVTAGDVASTAHTRGIAWADMDGDGDLDLYLGNATSANQILLYDGGTGTFTDALNIGDAASMSDTRGINLIDYDNDGDVDIYLSVVGGPNELIRNNGGLSFDKVATGNTLVSLASDCRNAAWADYDGDGLLDLYVVNYQSANHLMRNQGVDVNGEPLMVEVPTPVLMDVGHGSSAVWGDANLDNRPDLYVVNDDAPHPNKLLINLGSGAFEDASTAVPDLADAGWGHGAAWADFDNDGDLDLYLSNAGANKFFKNDHSNLNPLAFHDATDEPATLGFADDGNSRGAAWGDFDNDGRLDLYLAKLDQPNRLIRYLNNDNGTNHIDESSFVVSDPGWGYGAAWADYDGDGDLDLYHSRTPDANRLYRNEVVTPADWVKVRLQAAASNAGAVGARVVVQRAGSYSQDLTRTVGGDAGYMSQNATDLHFGLGVDRSIDKITVFWPSGIEQVLEGLWQNETVTVTEPDLALFDETHVGQVYLSFTDASFNQRARTKTLGKPPLAQPPTCSLGDALIGFNVMAELDFSDLGPEFAYLNDAVGLRDFAVEIDLDSPALYGGDPPNITPSEYCFIPGDEGQNHTLLVGYTVCLSQLPSPPPYYPSNVRIRLRPPTKQRTSAVPYGPSPDWETCGDTPTAQVGFYPEWASNWIIINPNNPTIPRVEYAVHSTVAQIALVFDEFMNEGTAANYAVTEIGNPSNSIAVTQVTRLLDEGFRNVVTLDLASDWDASEAYEVTITGISDLQGDALPATTVPVLEPGVGQIAISEIMSQSYAGPDSEWFEIVNFGATDVDINGWVIRDDGSDHHVISSLSPLIVGPGEHKVLVRNAGLMSSLVPGIDIIYEYGGHITLDDDSDELILETASGREIDRVAYGSGWPVLSMISMQWDMTGDNADPANWGFTGPAFGILNEAGTPSAANVLQPALSGTVPAGGETVSYSGALLVDGDVTVETGSSVTFEAGSKVFVTDTDAQGSGMDPASVEWNVFGELVFNGTSGFKIPVGIYPPESLGSWGPILMGQGAGAISSTLTARDTYFTSVSTGLVKTGADVNATITIDHCSFDVAENGIELYDLDDGDVVFINVCDINGAGATQGYTGIIAVQALLPGAGPALTIQGYGTIADFGVGIDMFVEDNALIQHVTTSVCGIGMHITDAGSSVTLGTNMTVSGSYGTGLWIDGGTPGPTISDITVEGGNATGMLVTNGSKPLFALPTSYVNSNQTGIKLEGVSSNTVLQHVSVNSNSTTGVYIVDCSPTVEKSVDIHGGTVGVQVSGAATPLLKPLVTASTVGVFAEIGATPKLWIGEYNGFLYGLIAVADALPNAGRVGSLGANNFNPTPHFYYYVMNLTTNNISAQWNCFDGSPDPPAAYFYGPSVYVPGLCVVEQ